MKKDALVAQRVSGVQLLVRQKSQSASIVVQESLVKQRQVQTLNLRARNVTKVDTWRRSVRTKVRAVWDAYQDLRNMNKVKPFVYHVFLGDISLRAAVRRATIVRLASTKMLRVAQAVYNVLVVLVAPASTNRPGATKFRQART